MKAGKIVVHGIIMGVPVPFSLPDNDLCHFTQPSCTIQPNIQEQMDYSLYVKESYPSVSFAGISLDYYCKIQVMLTFQTPFQMLASSMLA